MKLVPISVASGALMGPSGGWASADIATVNRNVVRCRTMDRIVSDDARDHDGALATPDSSRECMALFVK